MTNTTRTALDASDPILATLNASPKTVYENAVDPTAVRLDARTWASRGRSASWGVLVERSRVTRTLMGLSKNQYILTGTVRIRIFTTASYGHARHLASRVERIIRGMEKVDGWLYTLNDTNEIEAEHPFLFEFEIVVNVRSFDIGD